MSRDYDRIRVSNPKALSLLPMRLSLPLPPLVLLTFLACLLCSCNKPAQETSQGAKQRSAQDPAPILEHPAEDGPQRSPSSSATAQADSKSRDQEVAGDSTSGATRKAPIDKKSAVVPGSVEAQTSYLYSVYAGMYKTESESKMAMQQLIFAGYTCELVKTDLYMLRVKTTEDLSSAQALMRQLEELGYPDAYVTRKKLTTP